MCFGALMSSLMSLQPQFQLLSPTLKQKLRELIVQSLYAWHILPLIEEDLLISLLMSEAVVSKKNATLALAFTKQVLQEQTQLDSIICGILRKVPFERISVVEKQILRLTVFEYLHNQPIDTAILLTEANRLTKKFGYAKFCPLVHTILNDIFHSFEEAQNNPKLALC